VVNNRLLQGRDIRVHPLAEGRAEGVFVRGAPFLAIQADQGGKLDTPNGVKTFHAGDWICTDIPTSYAWIMDQQTFQVGNFTKVGELDPNRRIVFPIAEGDKELESDMGTGRLELGDAPPANASEVIAETPEIATGGSTIPGTQLSPADVASMGAAQPATGETLALTPSPAEQKASIPQAPAPAARTKATLPAGPKSTTKAPAKAK